MAALDITNSSTINSIYNSNARNLARNRTIMSISSSGVLDISQPVFAP